ncbi:MAG TPA: GDSL-type esterase/lipase family protein [Chthoniobacterales bacterium]|nr:GDSL-type esterase/lipase family protein [Chthoniobacterales bacterium]
MSSPITITALAASILVSGIYAARAEQQNKRQMKWVATWTTAPQDIFKGSSTPALVNFAFPNPTTDGANNQTLRMIIKPDLWGTTIRLRFSNTWGTQPVILGRVSVGLQSYSGNVLAGTNTPVTFAGGASVTIPVGQEIFSDPVSLRWVEMSSANSDEVDPVVDGHNLAVSIFIQGKSGPLTYHAAALAESFLSAPNAGDLTDEDNDFNLPYETNHFFLLDAVDVLAPVDTRVLVGAGSSSVDGSITTPDNNDRFLNWMSRRLHAAYGNHVSVVNEGIGGDTAAIPPVLPLRQVLPQRFNRDILGVSGITDVIFYAGTNDFGDGIPPAQSIASLTNMVGILHTHGINAIGATLISNIGQAGTTQATYDAHNQINAFILQSGVFDSTADFYTATADPVTKVLLPQYATHSDPNGTPDFLHVGRAGAEAEANTLDTNFFAPQGRSDSKAKTLSMTN